MRCAAGLVIGMPVLRGAAGLVNGVPVLRGAAGLFLFIAFSLWFAGWQGHLREMQTEADSKKWKFYFSPPNDQDSPFRSHALCRQSG